MLLPFFLHSQLCRSLYTHGSLQEMKKLTTELDNMSKILSDSLMHELQFILLSNKIQNKMSTFSQWRKEIDNKEVKTQ